MNTPHTISKTWLIKNKIIELIDSEVCTYPITLDKDNYLALELLKELADKHYYDTISKIMELLPYDKTASLDLNCLETDLFCLGDVYFIDDDVIVNNKHLFVKGKIHAKYKLQLKNSVIHAASDITFRSLTLNKSFIYESEVGGYEIKLFNSSSISNTKKLGARFLEINDDCHIFGSGSIEIGSLISINHQGWLEHDLNSAIVAKDIRLKNGYLSGNIVCKNLSICDGSYIESCYTITCSNNLIVKDSSIDDGMKKECFRKQIKINVQNTTLLKNVSIESNSIKTHKIIIKSLNNLIFSNVYSKIAIIYGTLNEGINLFSDEKKFFLD